MKLNPPETAPRDGSTFLADFGWQALSSTFWNDFKKRWRVAVAYPRLRIRKGEVIGAEYRYVNLNIYEREMVGWLPMPQIDDQGNVL